MSEYRIVTNNSVLYPYIIELKINYILGLYEWTSFTKYSTLEEARHDIIAFKETDDEEKNFTKRIIE